VGVLLPRCVRQHPSIAWPRIVMAGVGNIERDEVGSKHKSLANSLGII
jgi:hypothetical protein